MRFLQFNSFYSNYLDIFVATRPGIIEAPFADQMEALLGDAFSCGHILAPALAKLGYESQQIVTNYWPAQRLWAAEHGVKCTAQNWEAEILKAQIEFYKPDVLYNVDPVVYDSAFIRQLSWQPKLNMAWRSAVISPQVDFSSFDLVMASTPICTNQMLHQGAKSALIALPGFPEWVAEAVKDVPRDLDVTFSGQWGDLHHKRNAYLVDISRAAQAPGAKFSAAWFLTNYSAQAMAPEVEALDRRARWGLEMYRTLRRGRIVFNAVIDMAGTEAGNMRQFEITGVGSLALTEENPNLSKHFEPGREIETFKDTAELLEKINYYTEHPAEAEEIAKRGQERCLREHSTSVRAAALDEVIREKLGAAPRFGRATATVVARDRAASSSSPGAAGVISQPGVAPMSREQAQQNLARALEFLQKGDLSAAFRLVELLRTSGQQLENLALLRCLCLARMGDLAAARQSLNEELISYPQNEQAKNVLHDVFGN